MYRIAYRYRVFTSLYFPINFLNMRIMQVGYRNTSFNLQSLHNGNELYNNKQMKMYW